MLLRPKKESRGPLGAFFRWFNRVFGRATDGYVDACRHLIHKSGFAFLLLLLLVGGAVFFGKKVPGSFLPDEDQGFMFVGLQLAASIVAAAHLRSFAGSGGNSAENAGSEVCQLGNRLQPAERREHHL